jgi:hypothetical protein
LPRDDCSAGVAAAVGPDDWVAGSPDARYSY